MLTIKNKFGEDVMKLTEDNKVHILSEKLYHEGTKLEEAADTADEAVEPADTEDEPTDEG